MNVWNFEIPVCLKYIYACIIRLITMYIISHLLHYRHKCNFTVFPAVDTLTNLSHIFQKLTSIVKSQTHFSQTFTSLVLTKKSISPHWRYSFRAISFFLPPKYSISLQINSQTDFVGSVQLYNRLPSCSHTQ